MVCLSHCGFSSCDANVLALIHLLPDLIHMAVAPPQYFLHEDMSHLTSKIYEFLQVRNEAQPRLNMSLSPLGYETCYDRELTSALWDTSTERRKWGTKTVGPTYRPKAKVSI
jgi:hypothetical protein